MFCGRATAFASLTWQALILAWECLHLNNSLLKTPIGDLWENKFLFWSIMFGFASVFPVFYIPVINTKVFLQTGISWEWGIAAGSTALFLVGAEAWKWSKRVLTRKTHARNPEYELERDDPFKKYASFS